MNFTKRFAFACLLGAGVALSPLAMAADWPQFLGPNRDGISPETGLLRSWPETGPEVAWVYAVGKGYAAPAVVGDDVYFLDRVNDTTDYLRCLSLKDGTEKWNVSYEAPGDVSHGGSRNQPTVDDKYVYSVGLMGNFICVDRATHKIVWQHDLVKEYKMDLPNWGFSQAPILYNDMVLVCVQAPETFAVAFSKESGEVMGQSAAFGAPGYASPLIATLAGVEQLVIVAAGEGGVAGISLTDGSTLWHYTGWQNKIPIPNPTPLPGNKLFVTGGYDAGSVILEIKNTPTGGQEAVEVKKLTPEECGSQIHQPIVYKDHIYVNNNSNERERGMQCMTLDGKVLWRTGDTEGLPGFERGSIIMADGMLIAQDGKKGSIHLIDPSPEGYKEIASAKVISGRELWAPLVLSDGKLIVRSQDTLKCLKLK